MFTAALFIIAKKEKQANWWVDIQNVWTIHTVEHYSAVNRREVLIRVALSMDPENIMLSERGHSQEGEDCMIPFNDIQEQVKLKNSV